MRLTVAALAVLALLLLAPSAAAQPPTFTQAYQARLGVGDLPTTTAHEGSGWNLEVRVLVDHKQGNATSILVALPTGFTVGDVGCTCAGGNITNTAAGPRLEYAAGAPAASGTLTVAANHADASDLQLTLDPPTADAVAIVYVPNGRTVSGNLASSSPGQTTDGTSTIRVYGESGGIPDKLQLVFAPAAASTTTGDAATPAAFPWLWVALAFVAGALVWALLVSRGLVQARSRKQVVAVAAHEAVAAAEPKPVLEARKRALMAALKELELARMNNEIETPAYDAVKADLKKQTVTVMRALEAA